MNDPINHPRHYTQTPFECIEVIEALNLPFHLGAVLKYLWRYRLKGTPLEDLRKARWYLDRFIAQLELDENQARAQAAPPQESPLPSESTRLTTYNPTHQPQSPDPAT